MLNGWKSVAVRGLRRLPLPLASPVIQWRIRRAQRDQVAFGAAQRQMEFLLGSTHPGADFASVSRRFITQWVWRRELRWRPEVAAKQRVIGVEHLEAAQRAARGVVLCFLHHGLYEAAFLALKREGAPHITTVGHPSKFADDAPEHIAAQTRLVRSASTYVPTTIGYAALRDLVLEGETLAIAVDLPGSTRVRFVGRDLLGASGAARIAFETRSPVILMTAHQPKSGGHTQEVHLSPPLSPEAHASATDLLQSILQGLEPSVYAWPEAYEWPRGKFTQIDQDGNPIPYAPETGEPEL